MKTFWTSLLIPLSLFAQTEQCIHVIDIALRTEEEIQSAKFDSSSKIEGLAQEVYQEMDPERFELKDVREALRSYVESGDVEEGGDVIAVAPCRGEDEVELLEIYETPVEKIERNLELSFGVVGDIPNNLTVNFINRYTTPNFNGTATVVYNKAVNEKGRYQGEVTAAYSPNKGSHVAGLAIDGRLASDPANGNFATWQFTSGVKFTPKNLVILRKLRVQEAKGQNPNFIAFLFGHNAILVEEDLTSESEGEAEKRFALKHDVIGKLTAAIGARPKEGFGFLIDFLYAQGLTNTSESFREAQAKTGLYYTFKRTRFGVDYLYRFVNNPLLVDNPRFTTQIFTFTFTFSGKFIRERRSRR